MSKSKKLEKKNLSTEKFSRGKKAKSLSVSKEPKARQNQDSPGLRKESLTLDAIQSKLAVVCKGYAKKFDIDCTEDWFLLKLQEELGELTSAHLKLTKRARPGKKSREEREQNLREEIADVLAMTLLFARAKGVDVDQALADKWFQYLE